MVADLQKAFAGVWDRSGAPLPDEERPGVEEIEPAGEEAARLVVQAGKVTLARVAIGGVANIPMRLPHVEAKLQGVEPSPRVLGNAARLATERASPLVATRYKVSLIPTVVHDALAQALSDH